MDKISILFSKFAGLQKNFQTLGKTEGARTVGSKVEHLLKQYEKYSNELVVLMPELYSDLPIISLPKAKSKTSGGDPLYEMDSIYPIIQSIDFILEVRAGYRIGEKIEEAERPKRIFISHGRSKEWYKVQSFAEKDLGYQTLELAQEANLGRTVLQKLDEESAKCGYAIIVMTGDDVFDDERRARENVMHEIGFFQGKYGLRNVVLLHEEGVSIPSNIHGLVYISFPKDAVDATFGALMREFKVMLS